DILERGAYGPSEVKFILSVLDLRRRMAGEGVFAVDCGANIGTHAIEWAKHMTGWGSVLAIEAQERIFYALANLSDGGMGRPAHPWAKRLKQMVNSPRS